MNKIFDKLILLVALLLLVGGGAFFFMKLASSDAISLDKTPTGGAYEEIVAVEMLTTDSTWPAAVEQEPGVFYDVFTPPEIFLDEDGRFVFEGKTIGPELEWPIYLADISQKLYRIQLEGYIEEDRNDASKTLLLLFEEEKKESLRARAGDVLNDHDVEIKNFTIERIGDVSLGTLRRVARVQIFDKRRGEEVTLTDGERLYEEKFVVVIKSNTDPLFMAELSQPGEVFKDGEDSYMLKEINLDESSISVEKMPSEVGDQADVRILNALPGEASEEENLKEIEPSQPPSEEAGSDIFFN